MFAALLRPGGNGCRRSREAGAEEEREGRRVNEGLKRT